MKKVIIVIFTAFLFLNCFGMSAQAEKVVTDNLYNGYFLKSITENQADYFLNGVIDGIGKMSPGKLRTIYPGMHRENVLAVVKTYYATNPDKMARPVVDVILSGCK